MGILISQKGFSNEMISNDPNNTLILDPANTETATTAESTNEPSTKENSTESIKAKKTDADQVKSDSLSNYNSNCKFNFLFYFIYKVKYDENGEIGSTSLNFEF